MLTAWWCESSGRDPVAAGCYEVKIVGSELIEIKEDPHIGDKGLRLEIEVIGGRHDGKRVTFTLVIESKEWPEIEQWQRRELESICRAVGVLKPANSRSLHGIPFLMRVIDDCIIKSFSPIK